MKSKPEKNFRPKLGTRSFVVSMVFHIFTCIDHHLLPWVPEGFLSQLEATESVSGEAVKASREAARKKYYELTKWPARRWLDSSVGRTLHRYQRSKYSTHQSSIFAGLPLLIFKVLRPLHTSHLHLSASVRCIQTSLRQNRGLSLSGDI